MKTATGLAVRLTEPERDAAAVAAIYRTAVEGSHISFEEQAPTQSEMAERMRSVLARTPWLVAEVDRDVIGYAYASPHRDRAAYRWSVDISVYVAERHRGEGIGRALYDALLAYLSRQGFVNVFAGIALPNAGSIALHESIGMRLIGIYERVGFKLGRWHDVAWYGLRLAEPAGEPAGPTTLVELLAMDGAVEPA
jgi:L-amino acid N-acyltransferase YncA